jgi:flagellar hook protein FlgE
MQIGAIAQAGLVQAVKRFDATAQRTARAGAPASNVDLAVEAVEQIAASRAVSANLASLEAADDAFRRLLDIKV